MLHSSSRFIRKSVLDSENTEGAEVCVCVCEYLCALHACIKWLVNTPHDCGLNVHTFTHTLRALLLLYVGLLCRPPMIDDPVSDRPIVTSCLWYFIVCAFMGLKCRACVHLCVWPYVWVQLLTFVYEDLTKGRQTGRHREQPCVDIWRVFINPVYSCCYHGE